MTGLYKIYERSPGVCTDSRAVKEGELFFALKGENFDGNRYAADALAKGASFAVVDDPSVAAGERYIVVDDALAVLQHLATYHRRVLGIPVLAITGTNGKTTTKELMAKVLGRRFRVAATEGNLNNHIGVPLTLLSIPAGTEFAIIEMGASGRGEIGLLCSIAQPDFGLITNIGRAHLEGFGSQEGVRKAKGELYDYLASHKGLAFYCMDDDVLSAMVSDRASLLSKGYRGAVADGIQTRLHGDYNKYNIAAAAAVGDYFGVTRRQVADAVWDYVPGNKRSQVVETGRNTVLLDCYNANPSSMSAAIENLASLQDGNLKAAILGDMLELGRYSQDEHMAVISQLASEHIREVYLVGDNFRSVAEGTGLKVFPDTDALKNHLRKSPLRDYTVLIKGSRAVGLEKIVDSL
ncbi:MAG: Mur ligase domain-containing protein [Rikenellaceae bacterium]|nr:Mur ligase domain-containing protein [Rikenellaceae bacterium]